MKSKAGMFEEYEATGSAVERVTFTGLTTGDAATQRIHKV